MVAWPQRPRLVGHRVLAQTWLTSPAGKRAADRPESAEAVLSELRSMRDEVMRATQPMRVSRSAPPKRRGWLGSPGLPGFASRTS